MAETVELDQLQEPQEIIMNLGDVELNKMLKGLKDIPSERLLEIFCDTQYADLQAEIVGILLSRQHG